MELLERGSVLLELSRLLGEADEGHGRLVFLGGDAGVGKTSLVRRFGELVRDRAPLLVGGCDPLSTPRPLEPLLDVADRLPGASIRVADGKDRLFRDVLASFSAAKQPLVLVFEDVHWADEATLDLLRFLARRIFLSPKTVDHHVSRVLARLGLHSRAEVAREAQRLGLHQSGRSNPQVRESSRSAAPLQAAASSVPDEESLREHARRGGFPANRVDRIGTVIDPTTAEAAR